MAHTTDSRCRRNMGGRSSAISIRISASRFLGIATSAIRKATSRPWLTIFAGRRSTYSRSATLRLYRHLPCVPATMSRLRKQRSFTGGVAKGQKATRSEPSARAFDKRKDRLTAVSRDVVV